MTHSNAGTPLPLALVVSTWPGFSREMLVAAVTQVSGHHTECKAAVPDHPELAAWLSFWASWANVLTPLNLSLFSCTMGVARPISRRSGLVRKLSVHFVARVYGFGPWFHGLTAVCHQAHNFTSLSCGVIRKRKELNLSVMEVSVRIKGGGAREAHRRGLS